MRTITLAIALFCGLALQSNIASAQPAFSKQQIIDACWSLPKLDNDRMECHGYVIMVFRARDAHNWEGMKYWLGALMDKYPTTIVPEWNELKNAFNPT